MEGNSKKVRRLANVSAEFTDQVHALVQTAKKQGIKKNTLLEVLRKGVKAEYGEKKKEGDRDVGARNPL